MVHDTLCALQAPTGMTRLSDMMTAAGLRTARGTAFNPIEVKRVLERLLAGSHATRDSQGRVRAAAPHGPARFAEMMRDPLRAQAWFDAWRKLVQFDQAYSLGFQEEEQLAAAMRLVIYGGGSIEQLDRLGKLVYSFTHLWSGALRRAVLEPFDAELFARLEPSAAHAPGRADAADGQRLCRVAHGAAGRLAAGPADAVPAGSAGHAALPAGRNAAVPRRLPPACKPVRRHRHRLGRAGARGTGHGPGRMGSRRGTLRGGAASWPQPSSGGARTWSRRRSAGST